MSRARVVLRAPLGQRGALGDLEQGGRGHVAVAVRLRARCAGALAPVPWCSHGLILPVLASAGCVARASTAALRGRQGIPESLPGASLPARVALRA